MRHGIILTLFPDDPRELADAAAEAEAAGWDGVFTWDAIAIGEGTRIHDPWLTMAAIAMRTERVRIGAILTPPPRRRPWKLARETMTLDRLSNGRLLLPVGLGTLDDAGFGNVGEATDTRIRAEMLDESLEILAGLCRRAVLARGHALPIRTDDLPPHARPAPAHPDLGRRRVAA